MIYNFIFFAIVNPDNVKANKHPDKNSYFSNYNNKDVTDVALRVPDAIRLMSLLFLI